MKLLHAADLHLRGDRPRCRKDPDWRATQEAMLNELVELANRHEVPLTLGGDIFDSPSVPNWVISMAVSAFSSVLKGTYFLAGNHELPYHNVENIMDSAVGVLEVLASVKGSGIRHLSRLGYAGHFDCLLEAAPSAESDVAFMHRLVFRSASEMPPFGEYVTAAELLEENPFQWIFLGDMHKAYHFSTKAGRHVINPGCTIRQSANEKDFTVGCYLVDTDEGTVEFLPLSDDPAMVDDEYLRQADAACGRIEAFIEQVHQAGSVSLDVEANMLDALNANKEALGPEGQKAFLHIMQEARK